MYNKLFLSFFDSEYAGGSRKTLWREVLGSNCAVVIAIGGGGDIVSAAVLGESMRASGMRVVLASIVWERLILDPEPGPIKLDNIYLIEHETGNLALALPGCYAIRAGRVVVPQACKVASILRQPIHVLEMWRGELGLRQAVNDLIQLSSCDTVVGVDVGGDVLATGFEDTVWSPLADQLGLAAIANSKAEQAIVAVHSIGADGELPLDTVLERLNEIVKLRGYIWARGITRDDARLLEEIVEKVETEASRVQLEVWRGKVGTIKLRGGTRMLNASILNLVTFLIDARKLYTISPLAKAVTGTTSLEEAREKMNEMCVFTEYDLEEMISFESRKHVGYDIVVKARRVGRQWVKLICTRQNKLI